MECLCRISVPCLNECVYSRIDGENSLPDAKVFQLTIPQHLRREKKESRRLRMSIKAILLKQK